MLFRKGFRYRPYLSFKDPEFRKVMALFIPVAIGLATYRAEMKESSELLKSVDDALQALTGAAGEALVIAGGTDLLVKMRGGMANPESLICLERIDELKGVADHEGSIRMGSCSPLVSIFDGLLPRLVYLG